MSEDLLEQYISDLERTVEQLGVEEPEALPALNLIRNYRKRPARYRKPLYRRYTLAAARNLHLRLSAPKGKK
jgi:hypothetical protein